MCAHSGSPPLQERSICTVDDVERLPDDGNRHEILHGRLVVTPLQTKRHQGRALRLAMQHNIWCQTHTARAVRSPGGVYVSPTNWSEPIITVNSAPDFS